MGWEAEVAQQRRERLSGALSIFLVSWHNVITIWGWKQVLPVVEQTHGAASWAPRILPCSPPRSALSPQECPTAHAFSLKPALGGCRAPCRHPKGTCLGQQDKGRRS